MAAEMQKCEQVPCSSNSPLTIVLLGDLMIGRSLNMFGNHSVLRKIKKSSETISRLCDNLQNFGARYVWGDVLNHLLDSDVRIANLEGVFSSDSQEEKLSPYVHKIHPSNVAFFKDAQISCCTLANNHVLDCGLKSVRETVDLLSKENIKWCGFGNVKNCWRPAILTCGFRKFPVNDHLCVTSKFSTENLYNGKVLKNLQEMNLKDVEKVCPVSPHCHGQKTDPEVFSKTQLQNDAPISHNLQNNYSLSHRCAKIAVFAIADHFREWAADSTRAGINYFDIGNFTNVCGNPNRSKWTSMEIIKDKIGKVRASVDILIFSIHWGENFRWVPPPRFQDFAHALVDLGVDIIFGHSSHHIQGVEVYRGKFILYGCGDFLHDYEVYEEVLNIQGETLGHEFELYRSNLSFLYKIHWHPDSVEHCANSFYGENSGDEEEEKKSSGSSGFYNLELIPVKIHNCQVNRATGSDAEWLLSKMEELCEHFRTQVKRNTDGTLLIQGTPVKAE